MRKLSFIGMTLLFSVSAVSVPRPRSDEAEVKAVIEHQTDAMNRNDLSAIKADYIENGSIIDELPPFHWQGPVAAENWRSDFAKDANRNAIKDPVLKLGEYRRLEVNNGHAYAVVATTWTFRKNGEPYHEAALWTFALEKTAKGWRLEGWSWAGSVPKADKRR